MTASQKKHGKAIASDVKNYKSTYVSLLGLEQSQIKAEMLSRSAIQRLEKLGVKTSLLAELAQLVVSRKS